MNLLEVKKVIVAACKADGGGCHSCAESVVDELARFFPEFRWHEMFAEYWRLAYDSSDVQKEWLREYATLDVDVAGGSDEQS